MSESTSCQTEIAAFGHGREVSATEGWTPLEFYAYIIRSLGVPASFRYDFDKREWVADGPFTKPTAATLAQLEAKDV
jgi:hypothetical protein